jgi:hypothetical protein
MQSAVHALLPQARVAPRQVPGEFSQSSAQMPSALQITSSPKQELLPSQRTSQR